MKEKRTTIYLDEKYKLLLSEIGNLSEFVRTKLDEHSSSPESLEISLHDKIVKLTLLKRDKTFD